jgi:ABC-type nitrate/sulfonate/bicarbonate transport system ATPase subunit
MNTIYLWDDPQRRWTSAILVTHDLDEAILLGDRIVVLGGTPGHVRLHLEVPIPRPRARRISASIPPIPSYAASFGMRFRMTMCRTR